MQKASASERRDVLLAKSDIELGLADFSQGKHNGSISLSNNGNDPIICTEVRKSCGCIQLDPKYTGSFILGEKSNVNIDLVLNFDDFVHRSDPGRVQFHLSNGQTLDYVVSVKTPVSQNQKIALFDSICRVELNLENLSVGSMEETLIRHVWLQREDWGNLHCLHPDWLKVRGSSDGLLLQPVDEGEWRTKLMRRGRIVGEVEVCSRKDGSRVGRVLCELVSEDSN